MSKLDILVKPNILKVQVGIQPLQALSVFPKALQTQFFSGVSGFGRCSKICLPPVVLSWGPRPVQWLSCGFSSSCPPSLHGEQISGSNRSPKKKKKKKILPPTFFRTSHWRMFRRRGVHTRKLSQSTLATRKHNSVRAVCGGDHSWSPQGRGPFGWWSRPKIVGGGHPPGYPAEIMGDHHWTFSVVVTLIYTG